MGRRFTFALLTPILALVFLAGAVPAHATDAFQAGMEAFERGDYAKALRSFREAEEQGVRTPQLRYNLGATHYRLGNYEQAVEAFRFLAENPDWRHLAFYNLGLIAEARGDRLAAVDYYSRAREVAGDSRTGQNAARKLEELGRKEPEPATGGKFTMISAAAGYDDNAVLAPEKDFEGVSEEGDVFAEVYALTNAFLSGNENNGLRLDMDAFTRQYATEDDYSFSSLSVGVSRHKKHSSWRSKLGLSLSADLAAGDLYALAPALELRGERSLGNYRLELSDELSWIEGGSDYDYVTGVKNQLTARLERNFTWGRVYAGLRGEYNDREDLEEQGEFFSYSPLRGSIHSGVDCRLAPEWTLALYGQYRKSLYPDENRMQEDGAILEEHREDDRIQVSVRGEHDVTSDLAVFAEYSRTDNDSNFSRYSYESSQIMLGLRHVF